MEAAISITQKTIWAALEKNRQQLPSMRQLFAKDPTRFDSMSLSAAGLLLDYSKNRIDTQTLSLLFKLARECQLPQKISAMFKGESINTTEQRAALHTALRAAPSDQFKLDGKDITQQIHLVLQQMTDFVDEIESGRWQGYSGDKITDIVSIGIGGSFLGPKIASQALRPYWNKQLNCHFVGNVDGTAITEKLKQLDSSKTLFIISSKSFGTKDTLMNSLSAKEWFLTNGGKQQDIEKHFVAVTSNITKATEFGINKHNIFPMWDWVGGRYSLWSAIGLPIALMIGMDNFNQLLAGGRAMDQHFLNAPLEQNIPVILAMLSVLYGNIHGAQSHLILPYDHYLRGLPAYIQQLDMESNGKSVTLNGRTVDYSTGPVIWGGEGTNGQHAYLQLLHQGTALIPADFILPLQTHNPIGKHHNLLAANCFGQTQALMQGRTFEEASRELTHSELSEDNKQLIANHKVMEGDKPSNTILMNKLTPSTLGALIAMYEHKTFVQGVIWDINSFDQWGVELGKVLGQDILTRLTALEDSVELDSSSDGLINIFRQGNL